jgi:pimeloyl-ACP methyl ester carboxylesterase
VTGRPVANRFFRREAETGRLALMFPGLNYSCHKPLLYYTDQVLDRSGFDVLQCWEDYTQPDYAALPQLELARKMTDDGAALFRAGRIQRDYGQFLLAGKSIGTLTMASLLASEPDLAGGTTVWLTPLLHLAPVASVARSVKGPALFAGGDRDQTYDPRVVAELQRLPNATTLTIAGGDHSLNIPGDPMASVQALVQVVESLSGLLEPKA